MITDLVTSYSSVNKTKPDVFEVRISDSSGKYQKFSVDKLHKNFDIEAE